MADATSSMDEAALTYNIGWSDTALLVALAAVFALVSWSVTALGRNTSKSKDVTAPVIGIGLAVVAALILLSWSMWELQLIPALPSVVILWALAVTVYVITLVASLTRAKDREPVTAGA